MRNYAEWRDEKIKSLSAVCLSASVHIFSHVAENRCFTAFIQVNCDPALHYSWISDTLQGDLSRNNQPAPWKVNTAHSFISERFGFFRICLDVILGRHFYTGNIPLHTHPERKVHLKLKMKLQQFEFNKSSQFYYKETACLERDSLFLFPDWSSSLVCGWRDTFWSVDVSDSVALKKTFNPISWMPTANKPEEEEQLSTVWWFEDSVFLDTNTLLTAVSEPCKCLGIDLQLLNWETVLVKVLHSVTASAC